MAAGTGEAGSDVDVLAVGDASFPQLVAALHAAQGRLQREINPVVMTRDGFRAKMRRGDRFVKRVDGEPKIYLVGDATVLAELAEDRAAEGAPAGRRRDRAAARRRETKPR
jgi:hypothetical protein